VGQIEVAALRRPFLEAPDRAAVLTDFDGTLSAMVDDPGQAVPVPGALAVLARLVDRFGVVGVISGRPVGFLVERLGTVDGLHLAGLYGLELAVGDHIDIHPEALRWVDALAAAATDAELSAPPGVRVERKGLAVTLHVRTAPTHAGWIEDFGARQVLRRGLEAHPGRQSVELRPPIAVDKGTVVEQLAAGCTAVCYCGDDVGDLPAYAALRQLRHRGIATLAVGGLSEESPAELAGAVDVAVDGPEGVVAFLAELV
jgi:trehalose 6-phosphate phosphatase